MTRFIDLTARGQAASGKSIVLAWLIDQLSHIGIRGVYTKNADEHRIIPEIPDESVPLLVGLKGSTYGQRMTLNAEEAKLIEEYRAKKDWG